MFFKCLNKIELNLKVPRTKVQADKQARQASKTRAHYTTFDA